MNPGGSSHLDIPAPEVIGAERSPAWLTYGSRVLKWLGQQATGSTYVILAIVLLSSTAILKLISLMKGEIRFWEIDPVFMMSSQWVYGLALALELVVVIVGILDRSRRLFLTLCVALFGSFVLYHLLSFLSPFTVPCNCFGVSLSKKLLTGTGGRLAVTALSFVMLLSATVGLISTRNTRPS